MFEEISSTTLFICLIILLLSLIAITLLVLLIFSGLFSSVKEVGTGKPPLGKVVIAYKFIKGPYKESGQTFTEAHIIAPDHKCLGIYYDDPKKVPAQDCRYVVGSVLGTDPSDVNAALVNTFNEKGFKITTLPEVEYAVKTSFPHVTTLSILIGIHKAYPQLFQYIQERKLCAHPFLEFYDSQDIHFYAPLSKQEEFWVSECQQQTQLDGRGDQTLDTSDINTTLDTSHSVLGDESMLSDETARATPESDVTKETIEENLEGSMEEGKGDEERLDGGSSDGGKESHVGEGEKKGVREDDGGDNADNAGMGGEDDDNDNSSSSSFEVLKNDAVE